MTDRFMAACATGDMEGLLGLLSSDITLYSDGGGKVRAALNPIHGADRVARFLLGVTRKFGQRYELTRLNGEPALVAVQRGVVTSAYSIVVDGGRICAVHIMRNPEKLVHTTHLVAPLV